MMDLLAVLVTAGYGLGAALAARTRSRRMVNAFLIYALAASFGVGLVQRELWPFSSWPLVAGALPEVVTQRRIVAVDVDSNEHDIDYRAWYPMSGIELSSWMDAGFLALDSLGRDEAATFLTSLVERGRLRALEVGNPGRFGRFLGPVTAPFFLVQPAWWSATEAVPIRPFIGIRFYYERWSPEAVRAGSDSISRQLVYASPGAR
jgi:hypothetical protein